MAHDVAELLKSIQGRANVPTFGVATALHYIKGIAPCFEGGSLCPADVFELGSNDEWTKELKEASERLVYADPRTADPDFMQKSLREGVDISKGAVLEYDTVITSRNKDRDGDILEPKGFKLDAKMPLLWQHVQFSPIGKYVKTLDHTNDIIIARNAIADTALGRDSATLVKFGALRTSQGFKSTDYSPLTVRKNDDGSETVTGWHFKEGVIYENSLVSIPANADANVIAHYEKEFDGLCTAFSRGELKTDLVQHYAKGLYSQRRTVVAVGGVPGVVLKGMDSAQDDTKPTATKVKCPQCDLGHFNDAGDCPCGNKAAGEAGEDKPAAAAKTLTASTLDVKSLAELVARELQSGPQAADPGDSINVKALTLGEVDLSTKMIGMDHELEGSFEWTRSKLKGSAKAYLQSKGIDVDGYVSVGATFTDSAIICCEKWTGSDYETKCFRAKWKVNDAGRPVWDGEPKSVDVKPTIIEKQMSGERQSVHLTPDGIQKFLTAKAFESDEWITAIKAISQIAEIADAQQECDQLAAMVDG